MRIGFPMDRFPAAGHHDTGPVGWSARFGFDGCGQVHEARDRANHALRVINQPHQLAQVGLPAQVHHAVESGMLVGQFADLDEEDFSTEMIHHFLVALRLPPFDGHVVFPPGGHNPEGNILTGQFMNLGVP